jgi:hypothetical protein
MIKIRGMKKKIIIYTDKNMMFNTALIEVDGRAHATSDVRQYGSIDTIDVHTSKSTDVINDPANVHIVETYTDLLSEGVFVKHEFELDCVSYPGIITQTTLSGEELKQINFK